MKGFRAFKIVSWDESPYAELENGAQLAKTSVSQSNEGDLVGEGSVEFLI